MFIKIFFLLILLISSKQDDRPQIKILEVKDPKCSDSLGRVDFTAKYKHTSLKDMNSYFLLFFKDQNNKKRSSICHLSYSQSGDQPENGTVISDTVYPPESQEIVEPTGGSVTDIVEPTTPITPTTDIPTSEEGESDTSKEGDQGEDTSKEGDQEGESDTSKEGGRRYIERRRSRRGIRHIERRRSRRRYIERRRSRRGIRYIKRRRSRIRYIERRRSRIRYIKRRRTRI